MIHLQQQDHHLQSYESLVFYETLRNDYLQYLYAQNHILYKHLSLLQHSSENDCERVLLDCPIHGLYNHLGLVTIPVEVASFVYQVLCVSYVLVRVVSGGGELHTLSTLTGLSSGGMYCSPSIHY